MTEESADDVENNRLNRMSSAMPITTLRSLRISDNDIPSIDLSDFPKLRTLYADGNRLSRVSRSGTDIGRLENLSVRNQRCDILRIPKSELAPVKRLYLSGKWLTMLQVGLR